MNISAKNAAMIKIKYSFYIYIDGAYQKCPNPQEAVKSTKNKVETVSLDTLYLPTYVL